MSSRIERLLIQVVAGLAVVIAAAGLVSPPAAAVTECPPGSLLVATELALAQAVADPDVAAGTTVPAGGVVCVTVNIGLTAGSSNGVNVHVLNVTIVGRDVAPGVPPTITGNGTLHLFRTDPGFNGIAFADMRLTVQTASVPVGIDLVSNNNNINNVTFDNGIANGFSTAAVRVQANDDVIRGNTITFTAPGGGDGILLVAPSLRVTVENNTITRTGAGTYDDGVEVQAGADFARVCSNQISFAGSVGIRLNSSKNTVCNNNISNTTSHGILVETLTAEENVLDGNTISAAGADGIRFFGAKTIARSNTISNSTDDGIEANGPNCTVGGSSAANGNHISNSGSEGIDVNATNCTVQNNAVSGSAEVGIEVNANNTTVTSNQVNSSVTDGIRINFSGHNSTVNMNTVDGSGANGISVLSFDNLVDSNTVINSIIDGIRVTLDSNTVTSNKVGTTTTGACTIGVVGTTLGQGINVTGGGATNNAVNSNTVCNAFADGILLNAPNNTVNSNTVLSNKGVGIDLTGAADNNTVQGNTVRDSGQVGASGLTPNMRVQCGAQFNKVRSNTVTSTVNLGTSAVIVGIYVQGNTNTIGANTGEDQTASRSGGNNVSNPSPPNTGTLDVGIWFDATATVGCTDSASSNLIRNNTIANLRLTGLRLSGGITADRNSVQHNKITGSAVGIRYTGGLADVNDCNLIKGNGVGLKVEAGANAANLNASGSAGPPVVNGNQFKDNTTAGADNQGFNTLVAELNCWAKTGGANCDPNPSGSGDKLFGSVDAAPDATTACEEALTQSSGGGNPAPPPANIIGDVNQDGKVDSNDVNLLDSYLKSLRRGFKGTPVSLTAQQLKNANVAKSCFDRSGNPIVNSRDLAKLKSFVNRGTGTSDCNVDSSKQKVAIGQPAPSAGASSEVSVTASSTRPADTIYVQLYDLSGKLVLEQTAPGNRVELKSAPVTNGVYYYVATVRDAQGKVIAHELHKLVIVR